MERLTDKNIDYGYEFCKDCPHYGEPNGCNRKNGECEAYFKFIEFAGHLAELEDELESGQAFELPCKVGDKIWVIDYDDEVVSYVCIGGNNSFLFLSPTVYDGKEIAPEELCNYYVDCYMEDGSDADIVIFPRSKCFTNKDQAEARLKELQEGK